MLETVLNLSAGVGSLVAAGVVMFLVVEGPKLIGRVPVCYIQITLCFLLFMWWMFQPESFAKELIFLYGLYALAERGCLRIHELHQRGAWVD